MLRLRDVFSAAIGAEGTRIEALFQAAIRNRREQNKIGSRLGALAQRGHRYLDRVSRVTSVGWPDVCLSPAAGRDPMQVRRAG